MYEGKTKTVYELDDGNILLRFKDDACGEDGKFDPGANTVGLSIEGISKGSIRMTKFFFEKIRDAGIPTHYVSADLEKAELTVIAVDPIGKGLEVICRYRAVGSFRRRYGDCCTEGQPLDALIEFTLKDDARGDPLITEDALSMLGLLSLRESHELKVTAKRIAGLIKEKLTERGMELYDIKFEFGRSKKNGQMLLIDEISMGNMRVYKDGKQVDPMDLVKLVLD
ncbi:MAG: hypothetical protein FWD92_01690 [Methanomassiliicoccaceae archaeon]|nr:hypothetical protein [Methanomassiliicoccaceae archaeon]